MNKIYKPINGWTKKKIIEQIKNNMLNHRSINNEGKCMYRAPDGNRCAVGVFIKDSHYHSSFEEYSIFKIYSIVKSDMPLCKEAMIRLQGVHDGLPRKDNPKPILIMWIKEYVKND